MLEALLDNLSKRNIDGLKLNYVHAKVDYNLGVQLGVTIWVARTYYDSNVNRCHSLIQDESPKAPFYDCKK